MFVLFVQSPEVLKGSTNYGLSTDVFSFAVMMSEIITGEAPYVYKNFKRFNFEHPAFVIDGGVNNFKK